MSGDVNKTVLDVGTWWHRHSRQFHMLPDDLVDQSLRRLGNIALGLALTILAGTVLWELPLLDPIAIAVGPTVWIARIAIFTLSMAMFFVARSSWLDRRLKSTIGLGYEVVGAASIGAMELGILRACDMPVSATSSVVIWIMLLRLLVPVSMGKATAATFLSAATIPGVLWLAIRHGHPPVEPLVFAALIKTSGVAALLAVFASRKIYHLGTEVRAAREMGSYRLEEPLGEGGMGVVWRASHRLIQRPAAIKLIRPEALGGRGTDNQTETQQRFEREARATALLRSTHTVQLFDYGQATDGSFYYVMELLDGLDMDSLVRRFGPVLPERAVFLLIQACHSLKDAHDNGMIHRDVKPANIFVCHLGPDYDFVKVLDFGLVKAADSAADPGLTAAGIAAGTPAYMAPEMATGSAPVGPATDIYMLGAVAYWLLCGEQVFVGETPLSIIGQHISAEPIPVSRRTEMSVPPQLESVIMECLAKDPTDRPQSAEEVYQRLKQCTLDKTWTRERAARWWETHRPTQREGGGAS